MEDGGRGRGREEEGRENTDWFYQVSAFPGNL